MKVLVKEKIADSGVELLQEQFDVEAAPTGTATSSRSGSGNSTGS